MTVNIVGWSGNIQPPNINTQSRARNGLVVPHSLPKEIADSIRFSVGHRKKMLSWFGENIVDLPTTTYSATVRQYLRFWTGYGTEAVQIFAVLAPTNSGGTTPTIQLVKISGTGGESSRVIDGNITDTGNDAGIPDRWTVGRATISVNPGTLYVYEIQAAGSCKVVALGVWEKEVHTADPADTGVPDNDFARGSNILDRQFEDITNQPWFLWKNNGGSLFCTNHRSAPLERLSADGTCNVFDAGNTTFSATAPGFRIQTRYRGTKHNTNVPVYWAVYAKWTNTGSSTASDIWLEDSGGEITSSRLTFNSGTPAWNAAAIDLTAQNLHTINIMQDTNGTGGTLTVYAMEMFQYEG